MSGRQANSCLPVCYQIASGLRYLGFEAEVMAAYVEVERGETQCGSIGVRHQPPKIRPDYTTDGHAVLWAGSFGRLVDPTIVQHPQLLQAAHRDGQTFSAPLVIPVGDRDLLLKGAVGAVRPPFLVKYLVLPEHTAAFDRWLREYGPALDYAGLALADTALQLLHALGQARNLRQLPHLYQRLGGLLTGRQQLPPIPDQPPDAWVRLQQQSGPASSEGA
jgi:hypothetical protein